MITTFYPPYNFGGDGIYIYRLANELAKRGHQVEIIHCIDSYLLLQRSGPKGDFPNHKNITVHGLKSRWGTLSPFLTQQTGYPFLKIDKIEAILKENSFDVVHYHNISLVGGPKLLKPRKEITLYTLHEHWLLCPMHVLWKYNKQLCNKRNCFGCSIVWKKPPQLWRYTGMLKKSVQNVDHFISPSRFTLKKHHEMGMDVPITHIPHFLPNSEIPEEETNCDERIKSKPYFLFVGRLEKIKGVQDLIPVFKEYSGAKLLIAGDGEYERVLKSLAKGNDNVSFLGRTSRRKLRALYRNAIATIVSSICYEVFGIIIIESFSRRTPVIVNNIGAPPDIVEESGGGFIYNNSKELLQAMDTLRNKPNVRENLGNKGYSAFRKYWTEEYHLKKYFELIDDLSANKKMPESLPV